jgi:glucokinase
MRYVGIEIGGTKIQLALGTKDGNIISHRRYKVDPSGGAKGIQNQILQGLSEFKKETAFEKIGVGFGGPVDRKAGKVIKSHHISHWEEFEMVQWLESKMKVPVILENDANAAALAEATCGAGKGLNPVFYMTIGSGIGGGLVSEGNVYHGAFPSEVEIGHMRVPSSGDPKTWPTFESLCSGWALDMRLKDYAEQNPSTAFARMVKGESKAETSFLLQAIEQEDDFCRELLKAAARHIAFALSSIVQLFHPQVLVLGGGVSQLGEPLLKEIEVVLDQLVMEVFRNTYQIKISTVGEMAVPMGAMLLAAE